MEQVLNILLIEDSAGDARLVQELLKEVEDFAFQLEWTERLSSGLEMLKKNTPDVILLDLSLPDSQGLNTYQNVLYKSGSVPVIVLSGLNDEKVAVQAVREGAQDYLVKGQGDGHLIARAVRYAIERKKLEQERETLIKDLKKALTKIKTLSGLIPICASCKKIRDDQGYWNQLEEYIQNHSMAEFSHSFCPDCVKNLFPELVDEDEVESLYDLKEKAERH